MDHNIFWSHSGIAFSICLETILLPLNIGWPPFRWNKTAKRNECVWLFAVIARTTYQHRYPKNNMEMNFLTLLMMNWKYRLAIVFGTGEMWYNRFNDSNLKRNLTLWSCRIVYLKCRIVDYYYDDYKELFAPQNESERNDQISIEELMDRKNELIDKMKNHTIQNLNYIGSLIKSDNTIDEDKLRQNLPNL